MVADEIKIQHSKRVLVVDDDQDICECLVEFFKAKGFTVSWAFSGEQALDHVEVGGTQVVILDIMLPGISGLEVLRRVKDVCPDAKVVMMTGLSQPELQMQAWQYGACGYVTKPFDFSDQTWASVLTEDQSSA
jgi:DNA-binding response OmpR family regulator